VLIDMGGPPLVLDPQPAAVRKQDEAGPALRPLRRTVPFIKKAFADARRRRLASELYVSPLPR
jgi:putative transposase